MKTIFFSGLLLAVVLCCEAGGDWMEFQKTTATNLCKPDKTDNGVMDALIACKPDGAGMDKFAGKV